MKKNNRIKISMESEIVLDLHVPLTLQEIADAGKLAAKFSAEILNIEEEKQNADFKFDQRIKILKNAIAGYMRLINNGFRIEPVKCRKVMDYRRGIITTYRDDTEEKVSEYPLVDEEENKKC